MATTASHVPMTRPSEVLAEHHTDHGHSVSWVQLDSGHIIMCGAGRFSSSQDGGLTWSDSHVPRHGEDPLPGNVEGLVKLDGDVLGMTRSVRGTDHADRYNRLLFYTSADQGHTWSAPVVINTGPSAGAYQDTLMRTSSGRIIQPAHMSLGKGTYHQEGAPFVGGLVNGHYVSTDAHFYDPHFICSNVYYSDDMGQSWQCNHDGEILIVLGYGGHFEGCPEPSVCEVTPGKLLMLMRTRLGRLYQAWSYDDGETWSRPQPTQLASTQAPAQVRTLPNGHLLCIFNQQSADEIRKGFIRTRLSSTISRNGGGVWEFFQNIESIHEQTHVEPGPIEIVRPAGGYPMTEAAAFENDISHVGELPVGYGRWSYPSVLVLKDRILISHTYSYHDETGNTAEIGYNNKMKIMPLPWFYGGLDPDMPSSLLAKLAQAPKP